MKRTNYERDLARRLSDPIFRELYEQSRQQVRLAIQIREVRESRGWTQAELARRIGTSQPAIARLESGEYDGYTVGILRRIAQATSARLQIRLEPRQRRGVPVKKHTA
jgi:DNA-binding XRE family transcriptional regulator